MSKSFLAQIERSFQERPGPRQVEPAVEYNHYKETKRLANARLVRIEQIMPDPNQPRKEFKEEALKELAESIAKHGLLQPIAVESMEDGRFKLIVGERRYRACGIAGLTEIPCIVLSPEDSKDRFAKQLVENFVREDLNPIEKAYALLEYKDVLNESAKWEDVERSIGISDTRRKQFIRLLNLPEEMQNQIVLRSRMAEATQITEGHARALLLLNNHPEEQRMLFNELTSSENKISSVEAMHLARRLRDKKNEGVVKNKKLIFTYTSDEDLIRQLKKKLTELEGSIEDNSEGNIVPPVSFTC
ncbi:MAG: ParB/RepB/Spo0J family partition protein [Bacillota bacterium]